METINPSGVRKGIWTPDEDILLRKCIESYGEGKWHLVPSRAGNSIVDIHIYIYIFWGKLIEMKTSRAEQMQEELQVKMVELSKAQYQERSVYQ